MKATLVSLTQPMGALASKLTSSEDLLVYIARVSNPNNQLNTETGDRLLRYCIEHKHWSIFESVSMTVEVETSRAIGAQILRHRSFTFQEFSQRYAAVDTDATPLEFVELRKRETSNRQSSEALVFDADLQDMVEESLSQSVATYDALLARGVSPETARFVLPMTTRTTMYVTGNVRSWIHYFEQRCDAHAQKEHRQLALHMRFIFIQQFPRVATAMGWLDQPKTDG